MSQKPSKKKDLIFDIIIALLIIGIAALILSKSYTSFSRRDEISGVLIIYGSVFLSITISFLLKLKKSVLYFLWGSIALYTIFLIWSTRKLISFEDDSILGILFVETIILFIYGMYYLIRKKKLK